MEGVTRVLVICRETFMWSRGEFIDAGAVFDTESDVVRRYPAQFRAFNFDAAGKMVIEEATSAPGERRNLAHRLRPEPEQPAEAEQVESEPERVGRPWTNASKDDWVAYAATLGVDGTTMTKLELIDAVDAAEKAGV